MHTAFIFPGQGSQEIGMGKNLVENFPIARDLFTQANDTLNLDLTSYLWNDCQEFKRSDVVQAGIFTLSCIVFELLKSQCNYHPPLLVAGHSLGEYAAMYSRGLFSFEDGLRLIKIRGQVMQEICEQIDSSMLACIGIGNIQDLALESGCQIANYNTPEQTVLSGMNINIETAMTIASKHGFKRCIKLNTAGAYHCSLMKPAADKFAAFLTNFSFNLEDSSVITNLNAKPLQDIKDNMIRQIYSPVKWWDSIQYMIAQGVDEFIEIGHGEVLTKMLLKAGVNCKSALSLIAS